MSRDAPRLGRGLAALLGDAPAKGGAPVRVLPIEVLAPGPFQPRNAMAADALAELVESVRRQGILQPILARSSPGEPGRFQIIAGERRWRAAQAAGLHEIPVLVRELADGEAMAAGLVENLQRQDLNPIEEAEGFARLTDEFGLTQEQLGEAIGKSRSHVTNALRLLNLPDVVRGEVSRGALSAGHARALLGHPEPEKAALQVIARGLNVRQTEALSVARPPALPAAREEETETRSIERELSAHLGLAVKVVFDGRGGSVKLTYRNLDQLDGIVALLKG
ncbi:MAG: ParB/RepB/Spo0J family partition protein [Janthinobacterium lividum]